MAAGDSSQPGTVTAGNASLCIAAGDSSQPGTVTAGNASVIADGAAALVLVSAERASELGLRVSVNKDVTPSSAEAQLPAKGRLH